jgi:alginate O-acetyltransferase complex protein AlgI
MVYSSIVFLFYFLPLLLAAYYLLPKVWAKNILLFIVSLVFYAWGASYLVILLLAVGLSAWLFSLLIVKTRFKKLFLILAVITFVGVLIYFKYLGFIIENLGLTALGGGLASKMLVTIGVSFFIFQAISYCLDVYRKKERFEKNPAYVMLYICMFPQLISGPLVRYNQLKTQLKQRSFDFTRFYDGARRFIMGLGKKVLIANPLSLLVDQILRTDISMVSPGVAWTGIIAFTLQLFFDFSGYTDMAIGVGKMLGFDLPENFNYPYVSRSITEFWRRWHMTLSAWLKDYLFMPLSLSLRRWRSPGVFIALLITFTICGLWHGPTWNFIIWGAIQGLFLAIEQIFLQKFLIKLKVFSIVYTMLIVMTGFVFIMTPDLTVAIHYLTAMFTSGNITPLGINAFLTNENKVLIILGVLFCIPFILPARLKSGKIGTAINVIKNVFLLAVFLLSVMAVTTEAYNPFIYFRF